jgi:uncharacterized protein YcfJ
MGIRRWLAGVTIAGTLGLTELPAQDLQFKTMELHGLAGPQAPVYVDVVQRRRHHRRRYVAKRRSKKKSAAIVGGSAAGGAAIGALAGGGKGAAIGAIAGGGAGYVYDRKTHKKRVRVQ